MLYKRLKSNNLTIYPPTGYSKLAIFYHENRPNFPKRKWPKISTNNGPKFKINSVLESSILTLQNEILTLSTEHEKDPLWLLTLWPFLTIFGEKFTWLTPRQIQQPNIIELKLTRFWIAKGLPFKIKY